MYKNRLKANDMMFATQQTVPANTTTVLPNAIKAGGSGQSALAVTITAETAVGMGAGRALTLQLQESTDGTTFTDREGIISITYASAKTFAVGDVVYSALIPPTKKPYIKVKLGTNDATASGKVDVFCEYMAR